MSVTPRMPGVLFLIVLLAFAGCEAASDGHRSTAVAAAEPVTAIATAPSADEYRAGQVPDESLPSASGAAPQQTPDVASSSSVVFPADWCPRVSSDPGLRFDAIADISDAYVRAQQDGCETAGLTDLMTGDEDRTAWFDYQFDYTNAMLGCPLIFPPIKDGIRVFGPANTEVVGVAHPRLGRDDAARLIALYTREFARGLALSAQQSGAVEAYLWTWAVAVIDPAASNSLWRCDSSPPLSKP